MKWTQVKRSFAVGLLLLACCRVSVGSSRVRGTSSGTVSDPSGATVPDAQFVILDVDRWYQLPDRQMQAETTSRRILFAWALQGHHQRGRVRAI